MTVPEDSATGPARPAAAPSPSAGDRPPIGPPAGGAIRGAIKVATSTSTEGLVAGAPFSVFVRVQNPFEVPIRVRQITGYLPAEFRELEAGDLETMPGRLRAWLPWKAPGGGGRDGGGTEAAAAPRRPLRAGPRPAVARPMAAGGVDVPDGAEAPERGAETGESGATELQPGNSTIRVFTVRTRRHVWFRPSAYTLSIEVRYEIAGTANVDTVEHAIQVRASLWSILIGAAVGGVFGAFAGYDAAIDWGAAETWTSLGVSVVLALMAVVLFARKKDSQPIVSIEDFWGGVAIGFMVAYGGTDLVGTLLGDPGGGAGVPPGGGGTAG